LIDAESLTIGPIQSLLKCVGVVPFSLGETGTFFSGR